jgi:hypothetical protein
MMLADTSVWISHLRRSDPTLVKLLINGEVLMHPFVLGELACGNLKERPKILAHLAALPSAIVATDAEVLDLIERHKLQGQGLGWIDAHLLASGLLSHCRLWTIDKRLREASARLRLI